MSKRLSKRHAGILHRTVCLLAVGTGAGMLPLAQAEETPVALPPVEVVGTPLAHSELQAPASVGVIDADVLHTAQPQIDLAETLNRLPGIDVHDRQNDAQDLQIQSRGFGARSTFGVRGIQIIADGIPLTAPDGQGQTGNLLISGIDRIEVLRGPLAYQYGNSGGGVIAATSAAPPADTDTRLDFGGGADRSWRESFAHGGRTLDDRLGYRFDLARYDSDGFRDHSASYRNQAAFNASYRLASHQRLRLVASRLWNAFAQDPLGLTRADYEQNPRQATPSAYDYNTRKTIDDGRAGIGYSGSAAQTDWDVIAYTNARNIVQFLSIPASVQAAPARAGGVIDLARDGYGFETRATQHFAHWSLRSGLQFQTSRERRLGYENFVGSTLGVRGALRRDETNRIDNFDQYLVAEYPFAERWNLDAALRHSHVNFESRDHYIRSGNPDDSGSTHFDATLPALSLSFAPTPAQLAYVSAGAGFETPTFNEVSYRSDGSSGLNLGLDPARSRSIEIGWKLQLPQRGLLTLAAYDIEGHDEIVPANTIDGRSSFQNAGSTRRRGAELGLSLPLPNALALQLAATYLDARFTQAYAYQSRGSTITVPADNDIPGIARSSLFAKLAWRRNLPGWAATLGARYADRIWVDDQNSDAAESYVVVNASLAYQWRWTTHSTAVFLRVDNLFDARYAGSVIVNDGNGRYFEPAPGRGLFAGARLQFGGAP